MCLKDRLKSVDPQPRCRISCSAITRICASITRVCTDMKITYNNVDKRTFVYVRIRYVQQKHRRSCKNNSDHCTGFTALFDGTGALVDTGPYVLYQSPSAVQRCPSTGPATDSDAGKNVEKTIGIVFQNVASITFQGPVRRNMQSKHSFTVALF